MAGRHLSTGARAAALLAGAALLLAALLGGCAAAPQSGSAPAGSAPAASSQTAGSPAAGSPAAGSPAAGSQAASGPAEPALQITFTREYDDSFPQERGIVTSADADGGTVWRYETGWQATTELERVQEIGENGGRYYLNDGGTVVALDAATGAELWRNADFGGASLCAAFRENGDLLLCGYYGPDLCWLDSAGGTLCRVETLDEAYFWPVAVAEEDGLICVTMSGTPDGTGEHTLRVDPQTLRPTA